MQLYITFIPTYQCTSIKPSMTAKPQEAPLKSPSSMSVNSLPNQILWNRIGTVSGLQSSIPQGLNRQHIGLPERHTIIRKIMFLAKILNQRRNLPQMAPWQPWKQMVLHLKLQAAVKPVHPRRAVHTKSPFGLLLEPIAAARWP